MNNDDKLLQILENSACLSKGQLTGYIRHTLYPEELRAVELHLSSCALCNDALEGLESQADVDKLIASMVPPVLPAPAPKEKPKEKKETIPAAKPEPIAANTLRTEPVSHQETERNTEHYSPAFRPKRSWARPMGVAAALLLVFGTLWLWKYNRDNSKNEIAQKLDQADTTIQNTTAQQNATQPATAIMSDSMLKLAEKKHADSVFLARREEQRQKMKQDSLLALQTKADSGKSITMQSPAIAAAKMAEAPAETEAAEVAKKPAAAPAKAKEEPKKELTDFELGMKKYREKNYASALLYFKSAESDKGDPKHWEATYYSGLCNRNLNKDRKARKLFERIIDANAPQKKAAQKQLDAMKKED